jgi:hypothetical protein
MQMLNDDAIYARVKDSSGRTMVKGDYISYKEKIFGKIVGVGPCLRASDNEIFVIITLFKLEPGNLDMSQEVLWIEKHPEEFRTLSPEEVTARRL